jgi:hypothetical protein
VLRNTRAQSALLAPGPHVDALREIVGEVLDLPEANKYFADLLAGTKIRYDFPYPAPAPVGEHCPDLELVDDEGHRTRLHEHTRTGRGLLLATEHLADSRVDVVPVTNTGRTASSPGPAKAPWQPPWTPGSRSAVRGRANRLGMTRGFPPQPPIPRQITILAPDHVKLAPGSRFLVRSRYAAHLTNHMPKHREGRHG